MRRAAIHTAASAKAANTTLLTRTMTIEAESNAGGEINACQAYAKRAPAASARICLSPQPGATRPPSDGDHRGRFDHQEGQRAFYCVGNPWRHYQDAGRDCCEYADDPCARRRPRRLNTGLGGTPQPGEQHAGNDQDDSDDRRPNQTASRCDVSILRPSHGERGDHAKNIKPGNDDQSGRAQPRCRAAIGEHAFHESDRRTDAPILDAFHQGAQRFRTRLLIGAVLKTR